MTAPARAAALPPRMVEALEHAEDVGQLVRYPGGRWAEASNDDGGPIPTPYFAATTILALIARGQLAVVELSARREPQIVEVRS